MPTEVNTSPRTTISLPTIPSVVLGLNALIGCTAAAEPQRPNIVLIPADDLGYGDLGGQCGGQAKTPHLNRLAQEGLLFTDFHSNGAMCSPTRAAEQPGRVEALMAELAAREREVAGEGSPAGDR